MGIIFWKDLFAWRQASRNTFTCLIGCSTGDLATFFALQRLAPNFPMIPGMILSMINGLITSILLETILLKIREQFQWKAAFIFAFQMSFISMLGMEFAENTVAYSMTGSNMVHPGDPLFLGTLTLSLIAGYLFPLPYNYYRFKKHGKSCCHPTNLQGAL
ncbi:MAG: DUF4396 domain-containing protein [bacterium]|nr:DUF4396 domain-containing protein [bacterium]